MAISNMQQPQQIQGGLGSLQDPRQGYFLGKLVKKAKRAVKKVVKSPLGKMAILGGLGYLGGGGTMFGKALPFLKANTGGFSLANLGANLGLGSFGPAGQFKAGNLLDKFNKLSTGKKFFLGAGAASMALPFFMGGGDDEEEEVDQMDPAYQTQRARNYYSGRGDAGAGLDFMPDKQYVMSNFYAADGGRAGYADGLLVDEDDDEEEFNRSNIYKKLNPAFLNMGGSAGQAQAEQMLMMEYVKYKNKGGDLSFEQFVKAVMQQTAPEGAGMEQPQPVMMAANGGPVPDSTVPGYTTPAGYNKFDYRSGGEEVRVGKADGGQLVGPSGDGSRPGYAGKTIFGDIAEIDIGEQLKGTGQSILDLPGNVMDILSQLPESFKQLYFNLKSNSERENLLKTIMGEQKAYGGRIGKQEGGIMETEAAEMIDMGGMEKDYRNEGGFVAMGGKERADDVPARLSKNEFVFTADAVRNAGGGDIDTGAEVMENLMNNLEQGGQVSEDSQGLQGAQEMYDQQQMLQSRII